MAQLPVYRQQGGITTDTPGQIQSLDVNAQGAIRMQQGAKALYELTAKWQESKDAVENLDGKNKLMSGITSILDEAQNYNDYNTPEELQQKETELTQRMNELVPNIVSGFSNNQNARQFQSNGDFMAMQNTFKLQEIFRGKYGDMYMANLQASSDSALRNYTQTGNEAYKQEYFDAIETGVKAGYLDRSKAEKLKLSTNDWNYDYVYSQILENPYFQASEEVMSKIDPVHQRTLRNFARAEQKRAKQEAILDAQAEFYANPTQENLNRLYKLNPKARGNRSYSAIADTSPNYETTSNIEGYADAVEAIKELSDTDTTSYNGKQLFLAKAGDVAYKILKNNVDKSGKATLNNDDKNKAMQMLYKSMKDTTFKEQLKNLPNLNGLKATEIAGTGNEVYARKQYDKFQTERASKALTEWKKIDDIGKRTSEQVISHFLQGDINGGLKAYDDGLKAAIKQKYWYIPELQNPNLQVGTQFTVNGKVYKFQGFTQKDIIVETN